MRAYYYDNEHVGLPSDLHDSGRPVDAEFLSKMGVLHWHIPVDAEGKWEDEISKVATERKYSNRDTIEASKEMLGDKYEAAMSKMWHEYVHWKSVPSSC